mgnify:CR=1 FL=1
MKKLLTIALALLLLSPIAAQAQTALVHTTLTNDIDAQATRWVVGANTSMTPAANIDDVNGNSGNVNQYALIDKEIVEIRSISGTTIVNVTRGRLGTLATTHEDTARIFTGPPQQFLRAMPSGSCTETSQRYLPLVVSDSATKQTKLVNCNNKQWQEQSLIVERQQPAIFKYCTVPIGSVALSSFGTDTTDSATLQYNAHVFVDQTFLATSSTVLNGSAVDTAAKVVHLLYSASGRKLANSAVAGAVKSGNNAFQAMDYTATFLVTGPAWYIIGIQSDTADAAGTRTIAASTFNGVIAGTSTSVFGTVATALTPATTFTADKGPIACIV